MAFVDGTNLLTEMGKIIGVSGIAYSPNDDAIKLGTRIIDDLLLWYRCVSVDKYRVIRSYWFGSFQGSQEQAFHLKSTLRKAEYEPMIYQKFKGGREKKVDIAVAKEMLINAFNHNCDIALLISGDEDYVDLVQEVKRYGVTVVGAFFTQGRSPDLELACDQFCELKVINVNKEKLVEKIRAAYPELKPK